MSNPYEFSNSQWTRRCWSAFWRWLTGTWPWHPKDETPLPGHRKTFTAPVDQSLVAPVDTPIPAILNDEKGRIGLPRPYGGYSCWRVHLPGTPYQVGNSVKYGWVGMRHLNLEYGDDAPIKFPRPVDHNGALHREGAPLPSWVAAQGGWADNHILIYDEATGWFYEAIGYNVLANSVAAYGIFDENAELVEGRGVIWSKDPIGPYIFDLENDAPHSLLLVVTNAAGGDNDPPQFPWWGRILTLSDAAKERIPEFEPGSPEDRFARSVRDFPIIMSDHGGGSGFRYRYGNHQFMQSLDWKGWNLHLNDLVPADGKTGV